jgi:hypothetical protein
MPHRLPGAYVTAQLLIVGLCAAIDMARADPDYWPANDAAGKVRGPYRKRWRRMKARAVVRYINLFEAGIRYGANHGGMSQLRDLMEHRRALIDGLETLRHTLQGR